MTTDVVDQLRVETTDPLPVTGAELPAIDLSMAAIARPVTFESCTFDDVDLRNATIGSTLQFHGCTFNGSFQVGDDELSHTTAESDVLFVGCTFTEPVRFVGFECKGSLGFRDCTFDIEPATFDPRRAVPFPGNLDFSGARIHRALSFVGCVFECELSLNGIHAGQMVSLNDSDFRLESPIHRVDLTAATCGLACELIRVSTSLAIDLGGADCGLALSLQMSTFRANSTLWLKALRSRYIFAGGIDIAGHVAADGLRVERDLDFTPWPLVAQFDGPVMDDGQLSDGARTAIRAADPGPLDLDDLTVEPDGSDVWNLTDGSGRTATLRRLNGRDHSVELRSRIRAPVDLSHATIGWNLVVLGCDIEVSRQDFPWALSMNGGRVTGGVFLNQSTIVGDIDLQFSEIGVNLQIEQTTIDGRLDLESARIGNSLVPKDGTKLNGTLDVTNAHLGQLDSPLRLGTGTARTDGLTLDRIDRDRWQDLITLSRGRTPKLYRSIERYFRSRGDRDIADEIYVQRRRAERAAKAAGRQTLRNRAWLVGDRFYDWTAGYGLGKARLVIGTLSVMVLGAVAFGLPGSLEAVPADGEPQAAPGLFSRALYGLDRFLPVVDLGFTDDLRPVGVGWAAAGAVLAVLGVLLIPSVIAVLAGVLRRDS
ncbi:MAG: pentapeptide repeat-containing protein [Actinomycetota bacterium]